LPGLSLTGMDVKLVVFGAGKIGEAMVAGLLDAQWAAPGSLALVEVSEERRRVLADRGGLCEAYPGLVVSAEPPARADGALIAVKPAAVGEVCAAITSREIPRVLSVAAGVPLARLESWLGRRAVLRCMPNTAAMVRTAATVLSAGTLAGDGDLAWAAEILSSVGTVTTVAEPLIDAATGLSGSGPAYLLLVVEAMIEGGLLVGLPRPISRALAVQTLVGTARLLAETGEEPEALRAAVTSPGGTTAHGLRALESRAVRSAFIEAISAASQRARELAL
jgi:pyrroline-5-carboxylate reductase